MDLNSQNNIDAAATSLGCIPSTEENEDSKVNDSKNVKRISIRLIFEKEAELCPFWIGLFHQGSLSPKNILDLNNMSEIFSQAATTGLSEDGPLMLSDSSVSPARYIYLLPEPNNVDENEWTKKLIDTTKAWRPEKIGIYFAKELLQKGQVAGLLEKVIDDLIKNTDTREYFLLTKSHGFNVLLNAAIQLKNNLDPNKVMLHIFH